MDQWQPEKSRWLKTNRGYSFEEILQRRIVAIVDHPTRRHQKYMLVEIEDYIWLVAFVESGQDRFLKTLFPSRTYTRRWKKGDFG